jgi:hypothetical protein
VSQLPIFPGLDCPSEMFPHSVRAQKVSDAAKDAGQGRVLTPGTLGPALPCLIEDAAPSEAPDSWGQDRTKWSHTVYFAADPGDLVLNDLLWPQNPANVSSGVFFRVVSSVNVLRAGVVWVVRCLEQRSLE